MSGALAREWEKWMAQSLTETLDERAVTMFRNAFYCGAFAVTEVIGNGADPEEVFSEIEAYSIEAAPTTGEPT